MENKIKDCRFIADSIKNDVWDYTKELRDGNKSVPKLVVIQIGNNPASNTYIKSKENACDFCGIKIEVCRFTDYVTTEDLIMKIGQLNQDPSVTGIIVQRPLPDHIDKNIAQYIAVNKDVDGFTATNRGVLSVDITNASFIPCTVDGILSILSSFEVDLTGKHCVVIGRSDIVGKPLVDALIVLNATVTSCNSHTVNLEKYTKDADIIISAVGRQGFITHDMISDGAIIIDVGINRNEEGKLCGDVDVTPELLEKVDWITPVPYGVGQTTISSLMRNIRNAHVVQSMYGGQK